MVLPWPSSSSLERASVFAHNSLSPQSCEQHLEERGALWERQMGQHLNLLFLTSFSLPHVPPYRPQPLVIPTPLTSGS